MIRDECQALLAAQCSRDDIVSAMVQTGHDADAVRRVLRELENPTPPSSGAVWSDEDDAKLAEMRGRGLSTSEIVPHFPGRNSRAVYDRTRTLGGCVKRVPAAAGTKRESRDMARENAEMVDIDRRVMLFNVADGLNRMRISLAMRWEDAAWIDATLADMVRRKLLLLGQDGIYRQKESTRATTGRAEPRRVKTRGRNRRVSVGAV